MLSPEQTRNIKHRFGIMSIPFYSKKMVLEDQDTDHNNGSVTQKTQQEDSEEDTTLLWIDVLKVE